MDTEYKQEVEESIEIHPTDMKPPTLFLPHDVILEVEGMQLHVCKQVLADNSPMFERMFKSEFKEKDLTIIPLPGKKFKDIVEFLRSFYDPETIPPITDDTIFTILPLAEEYQVLEVKERCEKFIIQTLQKSINHEIQRPDLHALLKYASCADLYNLTSVLPLAVNMCAKYTIKSLTNASLQTPVSEKILVKIYTERTKLTENLTKERIKKGEFGKVLETFDFLSSMSDEDENDVMGEYEARLIGACERGNIRMNNLVDFIIAGETLKLDKLVSSAVTLASRCKSKLLKQHMRYNEISEVTKNKITERRMTLLEEKGTKCDVFLDSPF